MAEGGDDLDLKDLGDAQGMMEEEGLLRAI